MKIATKTGDFKMTDTLSGRVRKDDPLIECLGTVDELQAHLMHARIVVKDPEIKTHLETLAWELFLLGGVLLDPEKRFGEEKTKALEEKIEIYEAKLPGQKGFKLPGRTETGSRLHIARTVARRLERRIVTLGRCREIDADVFAYVNRLSDLLYIYARAEEEL